jgi:regulatory protein
MVEPAIIHYCKYQERSHGEVRSKLYDLGFGTDEVERQISELIGQGILNEERFARAYARGKYRLKQWGRRKIVYNLKQKGVSDYCIRKGLTEIDADEYYSTLEGLAERKALELRSEKNIFTKKAKITRFLSQKGFEFDLIREVIESLFSKRKPNET